MELIDCPRCGNKNPIKTDCVNCGLKDIKTDKEIIQELQNKIKSFEEPKECINCHTSFIPKAPTICDECDSMMSIDLC